MRSLLTVILILGFATAQEQFTLPELNLSALLNSPEAAANGLESLTSLQDLQLPAYVLNQPLQASPQFSSQPIGAPPPDFGLNAINPASAIALNSNRRFPRRGGRLGGLGSGGSRALGSGFGGGLGGGFGQRSQLGSGRQRVLGGGRISRLQAVPQTPVLSEYSHYPNYSPELSNSQYTPTLAGLPVGQTQGLGSESRARQLERRQWLQLVVERNQLRRVQEIKKLEAEIARLKSQISLTAASTNELNEADLNKFDFSPIKLDQTQSGDNQA